jgi:hypothetical protein
MSAVAAMIFSGCVATCYTNRRADGGEARLYRVAVFGWTVLQRHAGLSLHADGSARLDGYSSRADSDGIKAAGGAIGEAGKVMVTR